MKHWRYLKYVLRHKWFVFVAAWNLGIPWLGLTHDMSKFLPSEWGPYAEHFYGPGAEERRAAARDKKPRTEDPAFEEAWRLHYTRNKHHPEFWYVRDLPAGVQCYPPAMEIPRRYVLEMVADWIGAGMAIQKRKDWRPWYRDNRDRMTLHPNTRAWLDDWSGWNAHVNCRCMVDGMEI